MRGGALCAAACSRLRGQRRVAVRICAGPALTPCGHVLLEVGRRVLRGVRVGFSEGPQPLPTVLLRLTCLPAAHSVLVSSRLDNTYFLFFCVFFFNPLHGCEVVSCSFNLHFSNDQRC